MEKETKLIYKSELRTYKWYWIPFPIFALVLIVVSIIIVSIAPEKMLYILIAPLIFLIGLVVSYHKMILGLQSNIEIWEDKIVTIYRKAFPPWKFSKYETPITEISSFEIEDGSIFYHDNQKLKGHFSIQNKTPNRERTLNDIEEASKNIGLTVRHLKDY